MLLAFNAFVDKSAGFIVPSTFVSGGSFLNFDEDEDGKPVDAPEFLYDGHFNDILRIDFADCEAFEPVSESWSAMPSMLIGLARHSSVSVEVSLQLVVELLPTSTRPTVRRTGDAVVQSARVDEGRAGVQA